MDYKDKLRLAKEALDSGSYDKKTIEYIFPELKESKDEEIRKDIVTYLVQSANSATLKVNAQKFNKWIAWLEKQGEQNLADKIELKFKVGDEIKTDNEESLTITKIDENGYWSEDLFICSFDNAAKWELVEQNPVDKVEPKFKVGNWIISDTVDKDYRICKITGIKDGNYTIESTCGYKGYNKFDVFDIAYNLWTIEDARDGDILAYVTDEGDLWIMIYWFSYAHYKGYVHYHTLLINDNFSNKDTCFICIDNLKPATKEQHDILFAKMKEAGYTRSKRVT